ncbi:MAG: pseudoazurin [Bdellovibrionales bacterium]|nr:pseudoazurin [Bdellovibrionales bacterium]
MKVLLCISILLAGSTLWAKVHNIKMLNAGKEGAMVFEPSFVKANIGDTVNFIPTDASHGSISALTPKGGNSWKGELNKKVTTKMTKEGVYIYECQPHSMMGMVGVIQVGKATNLKEAKEFAKTYANKIVLPMNKKRLDNYLSKVK